MLKTIRNIDLSDKRVLLRVDFNVPIEKGKVKDLSRVKSALPTIKYLLKKNCQVVLISHLGRPEGRVVSTLTMRPVYLALKKMLPGVTTRFVDGKINDQLVKKVCAMSEQIIFLENLRFDAREEQNDEKFSDLLSKFGRVYVNEAFSVCHRASASIVGVTKFMPAYAGFNLSKEVEFLIKALHPKKPAVALIGGVKMKTKLGVINNLLENYESVMFGGVAANTLLAVAGYDVGASAVDKDMFSQVKHLLSSKKILLPKDVVICHNITNKTRVVAVGNDKTLCARDESIMDIGPETVAFFSAQIKKARTIVWSGPLGLLENPKFRKGSAELAKTIAKSRAIKIAGGGETEYAIQLAKVKKNFSFISTGGGAMLEFLAGKTLPGIDALNR